MIYILNLFGVKRIKQEFLSGLVYRPNWPFLYLEILAGAYHQAGRRYVTSQTVFCRSRQTRVGVNVLTVINQWYFIVIIPFQESNEILLPIAYILLSLTLASSCDCFPKC